MCVDLSLVKLSKIQLRAISKKIFSHQSAKFHSNLPGANESVSFNTLRLRQNGHHFPDAIFKCIFLNENVWISLKISLKFVPKVLINNIPALVQIMAWRRPGNKPLSEPMMVSLPTHICVTLPQYVKQTGKASWKTHLLPHFGGMVLRNPADFTSHEKPPYFWDQYKRLCSWRGSIVYRYVQRIEY